MAHLLAELVDEDLHALARDVRGEIDRGRERAAIVFGDELDDDVLCWLWLLRLRRLDAMVDLGALWWWEQSCHWEKAMIDKKKERVTISGMGTGTTYHNGQCQSRDCNDRLYKSGRYVRRVSVMLVRTKYLLLIALAPVYLTLAFALLPQPIAAKLTALFRLAKSNSLRAFTHRRAEHTLAALNATTMSPLTISLRPSEQRGHADHGWLKTFHTFSFASYQDSKHELFGPLRVINEDRVAPNTGFGTHSHREFEIFSYVVAGQLEQ